MSWLDAGILFGAQGQQREERQIGENLVDYLGEGDIRLLKRTFSVEK